MVKIFLDCSFVAPCLDKSRLDDTGVGESIITELKIGHYIFFLQKTCSFTLLTLPIIHVKRVY